MLSLQNFLAVGAGAAGGAVLRWLLGMWLNQPHVALPWGTVVANLAGGYLLGLLLGLLSLFPEVPVWLRLFLVTGFLGGLTTFSTFSGETWGMLERGDYLLALAYMGLSLAGSIALTALGFLTVQALR
jgi:CrcB protein